MQYVVIKINYIEIITMIVDKFMHVVRVINTFSHRKNSNYE